MVPHWIHVSLFLTLGIVGVGGGFTACWNAYFDYKEKSIQNKATREDT